LLGKTHERPLRAIRKIGLEGGEA